MITLTPVKLKKYILDYDYEVTIEQAKEILELLDDYYGVFTSEEIQMATDYILHGSKSVFAKNFL